MRFAVLSLLIVMGAGGGILPFFEPRAAHAQDYAAAGQHFAAAQDAFAQGQYKRAAEEYQASYDIAKDPALLFNIGESWQRAGDGPKALAAYRAYLKEQPAAPDRATVDKRVAELEAALQAAPVAKTAPSEPAQTDAQKTDAQKTDAQKTEPPKTEPTEPPKTEPTEPDKTRPPGPEPAPAKNGLRTGAWISIAAAVALATAGAILGLGAQNRADELMRRTTILINNQPPVYDDNQRDSYETLTSEGKAYNTASIALVSVAGAAVLTGTALFIADWLKRPKSEKSRWAERARPNISIGPGQATVSIGGSY